MRFSQPLFSAHLGSLVSPYLKARAHWCEPTRNLDERNLHANFAWVIPRQCALTLKQYKISMSVSLPILIYTYIEGNLGLSSQ